MDDKDEVKLEGIEGLSTGSSCGDSPSPISGLPSTLLNSDRGCKIGENQLHEGYIKLYRRSIQHPLYSNPLAWHYWIYCLLKANHTPKTIIWNKQEMVVDRGSFITGLKKASKETGLSIQNIRTAIQILSNLSMIEKSTTKSTSRFSYITICNYNKFQENEKQINSQTNKRLTTKQQAANNKQELIRTNKNEEEENTSSVEVEKKRSTSTAMEWPENGDIISKNLKDFLLKQSYFKDNYQSQLMHYEWWDNLSVVINGIDIKWLDVEFAKMRKWIIDNPKRSPTIKGFRKFVGGWLERGYEKERKFKK